MCPIGKGKGCWDSRLHASARQLGVGGGGVDQEARSILSRDDDILKGEHGGELKAAPC